MVFQTNPHMFDLVLDLPLLDLPPNTRKDGQDFCQFYTVELSHFPVVVSQEGVIAAMLLQPETLPLSGDTNVRLVCHPVRDLDSRNTTGWHGAKRKRQPAEVADGCAGRTISGSKGHWTAEGKWRERSGCLNVSKTPRQYQVADPDNNTDIMSMILLTLTSVLVLLLQTCGSKRHWTAEGKWRERSGCLNVSKTPRQYQICGSKGHWTAEGKWRERSRCLNVSKTPRQYQVADPDNNTDIMSMILLTLTSVLVLPLQICGSMGHWTAEGKWRERSGCLNVSKTPRQYRVADPDNNTDIHDNNPTHAHLCISSATADLWIVVINK
ncbi:hypothetical protein J6590_073131 [Homalodisca vitripennis]|nr:hypothetical protein J6590_073131 [Homalodisca vitripennis]